MPNWWQPIFQTTVDAYYAGNLDIGLRTCERLLSGDGLPPEIERQTRRNLVFYAPKLSDLVARTAQSQIELPVPGGWSCFNPSIATGPDGLRMTVRSSNYRMSPQLRYTVLDTDGIIRTTNYLVDLAPDLQILTVEAIDDHALRPDPPPFPVSGFEDARLFRHRDAWWFSTTVRDRHPLGICQIALVRLEGAWSQDMHLLSDAGDGHEKNWMPAPQDDDNLLRFVYRCEPTVILRFDDAVNGVTPEVRHPGPVIARHFSGGSQAIPVDGGRLALVHEAVDFEDGGRVYTHRWIWFDSAWRLARLSPPFIFHDRGVEYAAGLARREDDLVVSYGIGDREAWLATLPLDEVLPLLAPPLDPEEAAAEMRAAAPRHQPAASPTAPDGGALSARDSAAGGTTPFARGRVTIISITLTGNNHDIIGDALRSVVDWVDWLLVIDTGISDATLAIAREIAGNKLLVREFPWGDDFAAGNFALTAAAETGANWAVGLDSDERLNRGGVDVRSQLAAAEADVLHVAHANGTYAKERFFRLPVRGRYVGPTHEAFISDEGFVGTLEGVRFDELTKSEEGYRRKAERDVAILTRYTAEHPDDPRWFYYLGDSLAGLGRHDEAIAAFRACASIDGWDEEGAWALYRAAECLLKLDRPEEAVEACAAGMARHAGLAELPWLAAYASWHAGTPAQAVYWARQAIALGHFAGAGGSVPRSGFCHPPALWEGPYDVLRFALRCLGDNTGADEAERLFHEAKAARETAGSMR
jgi:tetratricopeptide (TPR) repeat protein